MRLTPSQGQVRFRFRGASEDPESSPATNPHTHCDKVNIKKPASQNINCQYLIALNTKFGADVVL